MSKPTVEDLLYEVSRLDAENKRLRRLVVTQRPELDQLRAIKVGLRDFVNNAVPEIKRLHLAAKALLPGNDDLTSLMELRGIWSDGRERVLQALAETKRTEPEEPPA